MPRLFTGLEIPPEVAETLSGHRGGLPGARWIEPADYHVTLRFIGDVDDGMARDLMLGLSETRPRPAMPVTLSGLDSFGGPRPRAVFARVERSAELLHLQAEQEALMRRAGLAPEARAFTPHVTLARLRRSSAIDVADYLAMRGLFRSLTFTAERFALFSARDSVGGGPYVVEAAYPFA
jgi:2'-5' RNA ligase